MLRQQCDLELIIPSLNEEKRLPGTIAEVLNELRQIKNVRSRIVVVDNGKESIVDLKSATLDKDGEVKMKRYLEGFPFTYYVVVRELHDLSGVLCRVLKGWFEGVVEQGFGEDGRLRWTGRM